jgi:hypothetical protein
VAAALAAPVRLRAAGRPVRPVAAGSRFDAEVPAQG